MRNTTCFPLAIILVSVSLAPPFVEATDCDLWTSVDGPAAVNPAELATFTVNYGNAGPDTVTTAYVNLWLGSGVPIRFDQMSQQQWDDLQNSALGTDTLGNTPILFGDFETCEDVLFQVQGGGTMPDPMHPMDPGASGSFTFDLPIPTDPPLIGTIIITDPPSLAQAFLPWHTENQRLLNTSGIRRMGRGAGCDQNGAVCAHYDDCFGPRLSYLDPPIAADLEVADDGSPDPTTACNPLVGFTPGRIAVIRRGGCPFHNKAHNAQDAGAMGVVIVNMQDSNCGTGVPYNADCVLNMYSSTLPTGISIPAVFLSFNDGEAIISELDAGGTVSAVMGGVASDRFEVSSDSFTWGGSDVDPDLSNNDHMLTELIALFSDSFESGDTTAWSAAVP